MEIVMAKDDVIEFEGLEHQDTFYDLYVKSYSSAVFDFMTIFANIFSIIKIKTSSKKDLKKQN